MRLSFVRGLLKELMKFSCSLSNEWILRMTFDFRCLDEWSVGWRIFSTTAVFFQFLMLLSLKLWCASCGTWAPCGPRHFSQWPMESLATCSSSSSSSSSSSTNTNYYTLSILILCFKSYLWHFPKYLCPTDPLLKFAQLCCKVFCEPFRE